jgi:Pyruvate/2-oxoacid:ferredoxin oxidoreductase delta subunit
VLRLVAATPDPEEGCGMCAAECPCGAISMEPEQT